MSWPAVKLSEVATIERKGIDPSEIASGTEYIGLENIESGGRILGSQRVVNGELASTKFHFGPTHILYGKLRPYLAKIALPGFGGVCSTDILPINPGPRIDRKFLAYFLRQPSMVDFATSRSTGANLPRLSPKALADFEIPLPHLEEQKRIAAILDQADSLRRLRQRAIDRLNTLGQAIFYEMFGDPVTNPMSWEEKALEDIVIDTKLGLVRSSEEFGWDFKTPYVRMDAVTRDGKFLPEKVQFTEATAAEISTHGLKSGDFLFNTRNSRELVGKVCVFDGPDGWIFNNNLMRIRFESGIEPHVIAYQFQFARVGRELDKRKAGTTSVFAVYWKSLKSLPVLVPDISLQRRFASIVESMNWQKNYMQDHLRKLDTLFSSLQHRAFRGEL